MLQNAKHAMMGVRLTKQYFPRKDYKEVGIETAEAWRLGLIFCWVTGFTQDSLEGSIFVSMGVGFSGKSQNDMAGCSLWG